MIDKIKILFKSFSFVVLMNNKKYDRQKGYGKFWNSNTSFWPKLFHWNYSIEVPLKLIFLWTAECEQKAKKKVAIN